MLHGHPRDPARRDLDRLAVLGPFQGDAVKDVLFLVAEDLLDRSQLGAIARDDVEAAFFSAYLEKGIFGISPFETIDREGVGELVRIAAERGRLHRPGLKLGVCGEHGGDPDSVHFFDTVDLDYVSCSPFRVPVARLEAGRATVSRGRR